jgi:hypothetical protein
LHDLYLAYQQEYPYKGPAIPPLLRKEIRDTADLDDKECQDEIHKKWQEMLGLWMNVVRARTEAEFQLLWDVFKSHYDTELYSKIICYIEREWLSVRRYFCHAWTNNYLHLDNFAQACRR